MIYLYEYKSFFQILFLFGISDNCKIISLTTEVIEFDNYLKYYFGLPFLPSNEIENYITYNFLSIQPDDEKSWKFTDYQLLNNFIHPDVKFPSKL
jgi:hypothetical protein